MITRDRRGAVVGLSVVAVSALIYWLSNRDFDAGRGDFFYLADAFLHGRTWLDVRLGPNDVIPVGDRFYVPFAPFPAIVLAPLVALIGPVNADHIESGINAAFAAVDVGLAWVLFARIGVTRLADRLWLTALFGFSTAIWWVTTRGGVWHTGHLVATALTLLCLLEVWGRRRALLVGLLAGAAFLTRAPLAFAIPFYALLLVDWPADLRARWRDLVRPLSSAAARVAVGAIPAVEFFFWYNLVRFGSLTESGYALATLPAWLEARRQLGLFSLAHVGMNVDLLFFHLPTWIPDPPFFKPDGLGMSVFFTSPGLLLAIRAPWRDPRALALLGATVAVLIPTLLYYGGGWLQYGYRYFLDSVPFVVALCALAVVQLGRVGWFWRVLIAFGVVINACGVYWASRI